MFEWLKKVIRKQSSNDIVSLNNLIQVPDRSYYINDNYKISLINEYKENYFNLLSNKTILFKNLEVKKLQSDMNRSIDLLLYNFISNDELTKYSQEELLILTTKLKIYLSDINSIETETILRLIALKELLENKKISHKNKLIIIDEINMLSNTLIIFNGQRQAITREIDSIFKIIELDKFVIDNDLIKEKYNNVLKYSADNVSIKNYENIDNLILKIAVIEKDLESYVYNHKKDIKKYIFELDEIDNIEKNEQNKKYLLDKILEIENKILLFKEYGNNIVTEEYLKKLYKVKFDILVSDINHQIESPINELDGGIEYYKEIIFNKIQNIIKGNNQEFNKTFSSDMNKALFIMKDYYTSNFGRYNLEDVLSDKIMLGLLLCFDKEDGFSNMLNENIIRTYLQDTKCNRYEKGINRKNIKWEDNIPLKSVFMLFDCSNDWLYDLYQLTVDKDDKIMYLPEGLISIDFDKFDYYHDSNDSMKKFKKQDDKTIIVLPSTMKKITGGFLDNNFKEIYLNQGLEEVGEYVFHGFDGEEIYIPDSVKKISKNAFGNRFYVKKSITFESVNSNLLNNKESLKNFLMNFICVYDGDSGYYNGFRGELGEAIYQKYYKNKIIPLFNNLVIKDIGIIIPSKELEMPLKIHALSENHYVINDSNYYDELIIEEIKNRYIYKITRRNNYGVGINYVDNVDASFAFVKFRKDYISHLVDEIIEKIIQKINQEIYDEKIYNSEYQSNSLKKTKN